MLASGIEELGQTKDQTARMPPIAILLSLHSCCLTETPKSAPID